MAKEVEKPAETGLVPGRALRRYANGQLVTGAKLPAGFTDIINFGAWAHSVAFGTKYSEPDPDFIARSLAILTMTGQTVEEVLSSHGVSKVQEMVPDTPGGRFGPFELTDLYVASSDFETGNPSYVIISGVHLETGADFRCTTGATNIQATLIGLLELGHWPIRVQFKRGDTKDKGGRYLLFMMPPD